MTGPAKLAAAALLAITLLLGACESAAPADVLPSFELIIPAGVTSTQTADQAVQLTLDEIAASERVLGRRLAERRIVRVQLLGPGDEYPGQRLDGTGDFGGFGPADGPGWMVEAVGTFTNVSTVRAPAQVASGGVPSKWGVHALYLWADADVGHEIGWGFISCGGLKPIPAHLREGFCP